MTTAYICSFYSILSIPTYDKPIDTVDDLLIVAKYDSKYIMMIKHSEYYTSMVYASPDSYVNHLIGQHINRTKQEMIARPNDQIPLVEIDPPKIIIASRLYLTTNRALQAHKPLHIGSENINTDLIVWLFPKKSPLKKPFNAM